MGVFAETPEIPVWKLIRLWIAEGFIKKVTHKNLEDVAEENLRDLVDRSLVLAGKRSSLGKIKTCKMHDLVQDMCLREAQNENFIHFITRYSHDGLLGNSNCLRRVVDFNKYTHLGSLSKKYTHFNYGYPRGPSKLMPLTRSVFFKYPYNDDLFSQSGFRLLRILDMCFTPYFYNTEAIAKLVHLRYLACPLDHDLGKSICKLWNIQILVIHDTYPHKIFFKTLSLPWEILNMPQLRHIHTKNLGLSISPPTSLIAEMENHSQTLTGLMPSSWNDELFLRIPNLKKLGFLCVASSVATEYCYCLDSLVHLTQLEKLKVEFKEDDYLQFTRIWMGADRADRFSPRLHIPHFDNFPPNLKKLTLYRTYLQWEDMNFLRKLPNLEVLKLKDHASVGEIWKLNDEEEDGFLRLKFLLLEDMYLKQWEATSYHFPSLEHLVLTACYFLEQIPLDFAEIQTLQLIELHKCQLSVIASAEQIQEEQQSLGNYDLVVHVHYIDKMSSSRGP